MTGRRACAMALLVLGAVTSAPAADSPMKMKTATRARNVAAMSGT